MEVTFGEKIALGYITLITKKRANKSNGSVQLNQCEKLGRKITTIKINLKCFPVSDWLKPLAVTSCC